MATPISLTDDERDVIQRALDMYFHAVHANDTEDDLEELDLIDNVVEKLRDNQ